MTEEVPLAVHLLQQLQPAGPSGELLQRLAHAVPAGQDVAALHPAKAPRNGAQAGKGISILAPGGTGTDP